MKVATLSLRAPVPGKAGTLVVIPVPGKYYNPEKDERWLKLRDCRRVGTGGETRNAGAVRASYFASGGEQLMGFYHVKITRKVLRDESYEEDCL